MECGLPKKYLQNTWRKRKINRVSFYIIIFFILKRIFLIQPYHGRKKNLYIQVDELFERRHNMIHHVKIDFMYDSQSILKEIDDMNEVVKRVYEGFCNKYKWEIRDFS